MTIKEYYDNMPTESLFENCKDIDQYGGKFMFDDVARLFYGKQGCRRFDIKNILDVHTFKTMFVIAWSELLLYEIPTLWESMHYEYDPIENYHRHEKEYSATNNRDTKVTNKPAETTNKENGSTTTVRQVTPFEDSVLRDSEKVTVTPLNASVSTTVDSDGITKSGYDRSVENKLKEPVNNADVSADIVGIHETEIYGNAGVTTTQQMIREQRELASLDYYKQIVEKMINRVCDGVI